MNESLSVIVPAYNEENQIGKTIEETRKFFNPKRVKDLEIIVVDDGSSDRTGEIARESRVRVLANVLNRGKGFSVKRGMLAATKDLILFMDVDLSTPLHFFDDFVPHLKQYDVVIGSRLLPKSELKVKQPLRRQILGKSFAKIVNLFILPHIKDSQCGFKLFKKQCGKEIFSKLTVERWAFDVEALVLAKRLGYRVKEHPIDWFDDRGSKIKLGSIFGMVSDLFRIKIKQLKAAFRLAT